MLNLRGVSLAMWLFILTFIIASAVFTTQAETTVALSRGLREVVKARKPRLASEARLIAAKLSTSPSVPKKPKRLAFIPDGVKNGIASYLATVLVKVILAPLDTIKTIQQIEIGNQLGILATAQHIIKTRGVGSLWSGTLVAAIGASPSVAMYFGIFSTLKLRFVALLPPGSRSLAVGLAAAIANTFACVLRVPYEVMKARLQSGAAVNLFDALQQASGIDNMLALFGGGKLMSQIIRDVPYAILAAVCYDVLQTHVFNAKIAGQVNTVKQTNNKGGVWQDMTCGAVAGGISTFLTTPMDVLKTRLMAGRQSYGSVNNAITALLKEDGMAALFTGWQSRLLHKIPANGLFFVAYEFFRVALGAVETRSEQ